MKYNTNITTKTIAWWVAVILFSSSSLPLFSQDTAQDTAQDTDGDGLSDAYETLFNLDPSTPSANGDPDSDTLTNLQEFQANTDPLLPDTDLDGIGDGLDAAPNDAAVHYWGSTLLTSGDNLNYVWPPWFNGAAKNGGSWTNGQWFVPATAPANTGVLYLLYDPQAVPNELELELQFLDVAGTGLHISLLNSTGTFEAVDIYGNLADEIGGLSTKHLVIPASTYPDASIIAIHRSAGEVAVHFSRLALHAGEETELPPDAGLPLEDYSAFVYCDANGRFIRLVATAPETVPPVLDFDVNFQPYTPNGPVLDCRSDLDGDGLPNEYELHMGLNPSHKDCTDTFGEVGTLSIGQPDRGIWHNLQFSASYADPVIVFGPVSASDPEPVTVRVRNLTADSCEFQLQEFDYQDGSHGEETVSYLVVEAGRHTLPNGMEVEALTRELGTAFIQKSWSSAFSEAPVMFSQVLTDNEASAAVTRQKDVWAKKYRIKLQEEEAIRNAGHTNETVGIIAFAGVTNLFGRRIESARSGKVVTHAWHPTILSPRYDHAPALLAAMHTYGGSDTANVRVNNRTYEGFEVNSAEEQSQNAELIHATENIGWLAVEAGLLVQAYVGTGVDDADCDQLADTWELLHFGSLDQDGTDDGDADGLANLNEFDGGLDPANADTDGDGVDDGTEVALGFDPLDSDDVCNLPVGEAGFISFPDASPVTISLQRTYHQPVVIAQALQDGDPDPAFVQISAIQGDAFTAQIREYDYLDGLSGPAGAGYIVVEAGTWLLEDGRQLVAGKASLTKSWGNVDFSSTAFTNTPIVLAQIQTANNTNAVIQRQRNVTLTGFSARLQKEETPVNTIYATEEIGYIALQPGNFTQSQLQIDAGISPNQVRHPWSTYSYSQPFASLPVLLATAQTADGGDPACVRLRNNSPAEFQVKIEEEQSKDSELSHTTEAIAWLALQPGLLSADLSANCDEIPPPPPPPIDSDNDGLPDDWEIQVFGTIAFGPDDDPDGDGLTTAFEIEFGLQAGNSASADTTMILNFTVFTNLEGGAQ